MLDERAENAKKSQMLMVFDSSLLADGDRGFYNSHIIGMPIMDFSLITSRTCADCGFIISEGLVKANAALGVFICL